MRIKLKELDRDSRYKFTAKVNRFGMKSGYKGPLETVLLTDLKLENEIISDHLWINKTKGFIDSNADVGDTIEFLARANEYVKGYKGYDVIKQLEHPLQLDYKLEYPTKFKVINSKNA